MNRLYHHCQTDKLIVVAIGAALMGSVALEMVHALQIIVRTVRDCGLAADDPFVCLDKLQETTVAGVIFYTVLVVGLPIVMCFVARGLLQMWRGRSGRTAITNAPVMNTPGKSAVDSAVICVDVRLTIASPGNEHPSSEQD